MGTGWSGTCWLGGDGGEDSGGDCENRATVTLTHHFQCSGDLQRDGEESEGGLTATPRRVTELPRQRRRTELRKMRREQSGASRTE